MVGAVGTEYADTPAEVLAELRSICGALPETVEQRSWGGTRWRIRQRTFAEVYTLDRTDDPATMLTFRAEGEELEVLWNAGHPFFRPGWGTNVVRMVIDDDVDWVEVQELLTDSYCIQAPKKLAATVNRPDG